MEAIVKEVINFLSELFAGLAVWAICRWLEKRRK